MDWQLEREGSRFVGRVKGRVDETTWEAFSQALIAAVKDAAAAGGAPLVVDLSGLDYMSSRGLRALTMARREAGEAVAISLASPNARMREILAISRYDKLFEVTG
ncbi:STAS domain-containing protein [Phenylobacterium sp.]|jgi:anti-anti-sigma factor|uniref:STAS domain-containing protein n=1 Tax=Phenylobacterium sp. TaxID=1871053 RepID=UPI002F417DF0